MISLKTTRNLLVARTANGFASLPVESTNCFWDGVPLPPYPLVVAWPKSRRTESKESPNRRLHFGFLAQTLLAKPQSEALFAHAQLQKDPFDTSDRVDGPKEIELFVYPKNGFPKTQLFSGPGKNREAFLWEDHFSGAATKKKGGKRESLNN